VPGTNHIRPLEQFTRQVVCCQHIQLTNDTHCNNNDTNLCQVNNIHNTTAVAYTR